jgi:hypothetical protein
VTDPETLRIFVEQYCTEEELPKVLEAVLSAIEEARKVERFDWVFEPWIIAAREGLRRGKIA